MCFNGCRQTEENLTSLGSRKQMRMLAKNVAPGNTTIDTMNIQIMHKETMLYSLLRMKVLLLRLPTSTYVD